MDDSIPHLVVQKVPPNNVIVAESKVKITFEKFADYKYEEIVKEEIPTQENLICSISLLPLDHALDNGESDGESQAYGLFTSNRNMLGSHTVQQTTHLTVSIKGFEETIWKSGKHQLQVTASVQGIVFANSGSKNINKEDLLSVIVKDIDRSTFTSRLTAEGSLVLVITVMIFGPNSSLSRNKFTNLNHNSEVVKLTSKLLESGAYSDFTINVQNEEFKVHRNILAAASPYFDRMFSTDMAEAKSNQCPDNQFDPRIIKHMLEFIYAGKVPGNIGDVAKELFEAADYYEIENLKEICKEELPDKLTVENAMETYEWAGTYDLEELKLAAWKIIKRDIIKDFTLSDKEMPPAETIQEILECKKNLQELYKKVQNADDPAVKRRRC